MPVSKAQQKAVNKYMAANYDRINLTVPKGQKEVIQAHAEANGESVNGFINRAIGEAMGTVSVKALQNAAGTPQSPGDILTPEALKTAQDAAEKAGETVPEFVGAGRGDAGEAGQGGIRHPAERKSPGSFRDLT